MEHIKLPQDAKVASRNRGIAFLTYADSEQASTALAMDGQMFMSRKLTVNMASDGGSGGNRSVTGRSKSPSIQLDGDSESISAPRKSENDSSNIEGRRQRTIAISHVPDTVNESRIKAMAEKLGPVRKVILKTNHQGALIEFENVADAGRAMIELDSLEIDPGRHIRVTTEKEMFQQKPEHKQDQFAKRPPPNAPQAAANGPVKRPAQPGIRKGGHLGQRSAALFQSGGKNGTVSEEQGEGSKKSNDDFRNLINKGT